MPTQLKPFRLVCNSLSCGSQATINTREDLINNTDERNRYIMVRHGYSARNPDNILVGKYPEKVKYPLLEKGIQEAQVSAEKLKDQGIDVIITSPLARALETAEILAHAIVAEQGAMTMILDTRLCDYDTGIFDGKQDHELRVLAGYSDVAQLFEVPPPEGETYTELRNRVMELFKECEERYTNQTIAFVSHGDPLWIIDSSIRGLNIAETVESRNAGDYIPTGSFQEIKYTEFPYNELGELDFSKKHLKQCKFICKQCRKRRLQVR